MDASPQALPDDAVELRAVAVRLMSERDLLLELTLRLQHIIDKLRRAQFGKRSEALDPDQLQLGLEDLEQAAAEVVAEQEKASPALKAERTRKSRDTRPSLPDHLPRSMWSSA